jgi:hypothetical protein
VKPLVFIVVAVAGVAVAAWRARRRAGRQRQLMLLCRRAGLRFLPLDPFEDSAWLPFRLFGRGTSRGTENAVWSTADDGIRVFDYWYVDDRDGTTVRERLTCAVADLPFTVPRLVVEPRDPIDLAADAVGMDRIDLELEAFNRRFEVRSADRRFAHAFLDQRMMQALLGLPASVSLTVNEDRLLLQAPLLPAPQVLFLLDVARALRGRVPTVVASLYPPRAMTAPHEARWLQGRWTPEPVPPASADG